MLLNIQILMQQENNLIKEIIFPIMYFSESDPMLYVRESKKGFGYTSQDLLEEGIFNNLEFVDASGQVYKTIKAEKIRYRGLWGFNPLLKGRQIEVKLYIEKTYDLTFEQIKQLIQAKLKIRNTPIALGRSRQELLTMLNDAKTIRELFCIIK